MGFSRQAYYRVVAEKSGVSDQVVHLASSELSKARRRCPSMSCRSMYEDFGHHLPIGRDKSIELFMDMGYRVRYPNDTEGLLSQASVNSLICRWRKM